MFYSSRWYKKIYVEKIIKNHNLKSIEEICDFLFKKDESGKYLLDVISTNKESKQSVIQKLNSIWFFFVYWIIIAPICFIMTGRVGVDQRSLLGKIMVKLIGKVANQNKRYDYKSGYAHYLTKEEFKKKLEEDGVSDLYSFQKRYYDEQYNENTSFIIEEPNDIYRTEGTKGSRFNQLWSVTLLFVLFPFVGAYRWLKYDDFGFDQKGKMIKWFKKINKLDDN